MSYLKSVIILAASLSATVAHADPEVAIGTPTHTFIGEFDPFVVGDVCITYVNIENDALVPKGYYGIIEDLEICEFALAFEEESEPTKVIFDAEDVKPVVSAQALEALNKFEKAIYLTTGPDLFSSFLGEAGETPVGLTGNVGETGALGLIDTEFVSLNSETLRQDLANLGNRLFGDDCNGVPALPTDLSFKKNESPMAFLDFLRSSTLDWDASLTQVQIDALEAWMGEADADKLSVYYGRADFDQCGVSGNVSYNLIWNEGTQQVLFLVMHQAFVPNS